MNHRLREIRQKAGFETAGSAAKAFGWSAPTYTAHENGTRGFSIDQVESYASAFRGDPVYLAFGRKSSEDKVADIPASTLTEVLRLILSHPATKDLPADSISQLVVEICRYVHRSGAGGLENVIDFQLHKMKTA